MLASARLKYLGVSAQKTRLVVDQVRGKNVGEALTILRYSPKHVSRDLREAAEVGGGQRAAQGPGRRRGSADDRAGPGRRCAAAQARPRREHGADLRPVEACVSRDDRSGPDAPARPGLTEDSVGQKVHPYGFRIGFNKTWRSRWYAEKKYAELLHEDLRLRDELKRRLGHAGVSAHRDRARGEQAEGQHPHLAPGDHHRPQGGRGRSAEGRDPQAHRRDVFINILEIDKPEIDAQLVAEAIGMQLVKRVAFRRAMRKAVESAQRFGAQGHQGPRGRAARGRGDRALRVVPRGAAAAAHPARRRGLRVRRGPHDLRRDRRSRSGSTAARRARSAWPQGAAR